MDLLAGLSPNLTDKKMAAPLSWPATDITLVNSAYML
jgi:hypothetical protein